MTQAHPMRWRLAGALSVTVLVAYYDRTNLFLALPLIAQEFGWSETDVAARGGLLASAFFLAYGFANIFITPLALRFGARRSLAVIVGLWAVCSVLGAWMSQVFTLFVASRVLLGLAEGVHMPLNSVLTRRWFPQNERSRANSLWVAGSYASALTGPLFMVPLMAAFGWRNGFYLLALGGLIISLPLVLLQVRNHPPGNTSDPPPVSMRATFALLQRPNFLLMCFAGICAGAIMQGIATWLPNYLTHLGADYAQLSWMAPLPFVVTLFGVAFWSFAGDLSGKRTLVAAVGMAGCAALAWPAFTAPSPALALAFVSACFFATSAFAANEFSVIQDILPGEQTGGGVGLYNGINLGVGGAIGPLFMGFVVNQPENQLGIGVVSMVALACAASMLVLHLRARRPAS